MDNPEISSCDILVDKVLEKKWFNCSALKCVYNTVNIDTFHHGCELPSLEITEIGT
ncbi:MAG: hypothetical protein HQK91_10755 [Nitrospirae bacterium]|nr:hypothetical protein [Nitrospirota bacterium]MBF0541913.1 hypothetical protein [Nitrospirota bacterium]